MQDSLQSQFTNVSLSSNQSVFIDFNKTVDPASILLFIEKDEDEDFSPFILEIILNEGLSSYETENNISEWLASATTVKIRYLSYFRKHYISLHICNMAKSIILISSYVFVHDLDRDTLSGKFLLVLTTSISNILLVLTEKILILN